MQIFDQNFFVPGSSHAYAFGSIKEEKPGQQSFGNESSLHKKPSSNGHVNTEKNALHISLDGKSSFGAVAGATKASASGNTISLLPLPPGRFGTSPPGLPPLPSYSGRAEPLPHEPPAPIRASPPPPAPPAPIRDSPTPPAPPAPIRASPPAPPPAPSPYMNPASSNTATRPPPPPIPPGAKPGPRPPAPPSTGLAPPRPPPPMPFGSKVPRPPGGPQRTSNAVSGEGSGSGNDTNTPKAKLKPFFWDKVAANPDHSMVWSQIKSGSFQYVTTLSLFLLLLLMPTVQYVILDSTFAGSMRR